MTELYGDPEFATFAIFVISGVVVAIWRIIRQGDVNQKVEAGQTTLAGLISDLQEQIEKLEREALNRDRMHRESIHAYELQLAEQRGRIGSLEQQVKDSQAASEKRIREVVELTGKIAHLEQQTEALRRSANEHGATIQELNTQLAQAKQENERLRQMIHERVDAVRIPLIAQLQQEQNTVAALRKQIFVLEEQLKGISPREKLPETGLLEDSPSDAGESSEEKPAEASPESAGV